MGLQGSPLAPIKILNFLTLANQRTLAGPMKNPYLGLSNRLLETMAENSPCCHFVEETRLLEPILLR